MPRFRCSRPVFVEAMQYNVHAGTDFYDFVKRCGGGGCHYNELKWLTFSHDEGAATLKPGDWLIRWPTGSLQACPGSMFPNDFEPLRE